MAFKKEQVRTGVSSEEKSTWIVGVSLVLIFGWYFTKILTEAWSTPVDSIAYQDLLALMVVVFVGVVIAGHVVSAVITRDSDGQDETDRRIDRFGEYIGGYVLGGGMLVVLVMAINEVEYFWIVHTALGIMVLSELITSVTKLAVYKTGFRVGTEDSGYELG